ncbi:hypothetical protein Curi_c13580 [Gottschalkia acidurici 9a]|uniref:Uncharacterized protein n=1 Tax=Gottschalkia acidurici (strain ATCC 7906 / DSM 604 / BCRC 14475 / CIP 104303 / KCTC 5404 / NCIMB 10678 / 9a) TaxID=1128398 RepID=K0AX38_GOTA9|nr:hypothetical protein [Gottschalkia acidurici]AFS78368.1 hypothetical protein Curi_c13580 [Gottschalkia acidurici 9a]
MYSYEIQRYYTQYEKWFMESILIEVKYQIDGNGYVSVFAVTTTNAEDGSNFFENETLNNPIEPEE